MQDPLMPSMPNGTPWWGYLLALAIGGSGLRIVQALLEGRKLEKNEYRELLQGQLTTQSEQIEELQDKLEQTQNERLAALERENAELRDEVANLRAHVELLEQKLAGKG